MLLNSLALSQFRAAVHHADTSDSRMPAPRYRCATRLSSLTSQLLESELSHHVLPESIDHPLASERDQRDLAGLTGLEAHGRAGGDIEAHTSRSLAIEPQLWIGLEEMVVRADLDRPIATIGDREGNRLAASIELDLTFLDQHFAGDHCVLASCSASRSWLPRIGEHGEGLSYRLVHRHQFRSIGKGRFYLDVMDHFGNAFHHLRPREHVRALFHQLGDGLTVARAFDDEIGDERHALRVIELDAALQATAPHHRSHGNKQLVLFTRGQVHGWPCSSPSPHRTFT